MWERQLGGDVEVERGSRLEDPRCVGLTPSLVGSQAPQPGRASRAVEVARSWFCLRLWAATSPPPSPLLPEPRSPLVPPRLILLFLLLNMPRPLEPPGLPICCSLCLEHFSTPELLPISAYTSVPWEIALDLGWVRGPPLCACQDRSNVTLGCHFCLLVSPTPVCLSVCLSASFLEVGSVSCSPPSPQLQHRAWNVE